MKVYKTLKEYELAEKSRAFDEICCLAKETLLPIRDGVCTNSSWCLMFRLLEEIESLEYTINESIDSLSN